MITAAAVAATVFTFDQLLYRSIHIQFNRAKLSNYLSQIPFGVGEHENIYIYSHRMTVKTITLITYPNIYLYRKIVGIVEANYMLNISH